MARHGKRPIARLESLGLLTPALIASHLICLEDGEIDLIRRSGPGVALCLSSGLALGDGLPSLAALAVSRAAGVRMSLGTDGASLGPAQDLWSDIKLLALHGHIASRSPLFGESEVLDAATRGGAAVLGLDAEIGTLEAAKWADLCCLDLGCSVMQPTLGAARPTASRGRPRPRERCLGRGAAAPVRGTIHAPGLERARRTLERGRRAGESHGAGMSALRNPECRPRGARQVRCPRAALVGPERAREAVA